MDPIKVLTEKIEGTLIRKDGRLNSPAIASNKNADLVLEATNAVNQHVDDLQDFAQVWWHIKNNNFATPVCAGCSNLVIWNVTSKKYNTFCSQNCAVTCDIAKERTRIQKSGVARTKESREKQSRSLMGHEHSDHTKQLLSNQKRGKLNPQYRKMPWNFGLTGEANPNYGKRRPGTGLKGKLNPQYGKSPSIKAGRGIYGKFNGVHFRSSLELFYLMFWHESGVVVESAESKEFRVEYITEMGDTKTYSPDFFIKEENILMEIKPEKLHNNSVVKRKFEALKQHHTDKKCVLLGFIQIGDFIKSTIGTEKIDKYIERSILQITDRQYGRLKNNYGDIIRSIV